jgi:hypothetical protein
MDRVDILLAGEGDDALDVEIGGHRPLAFADEVGLVRLEAVHAEAVLLGVDGHGAQAHLVRGPEDADGDLGAVGGHQLLERRRVFGDGCLGRRGGRAA